MYEVSGRREDDLLLRIITLMLLSGTIQGSGGGPSISLENLATPFLFAEAFSRDFDLRDILTLSLLTSGATPAGTTPAGTTPAGTTPAGTTPANLLPLLPLILREPRFASRYSRFAREIEEGEPDKRARRVQLQLEKLRSELADAFVRLRAAEDALADLRSRAAGESIISDRSDDEQD
jgi:hypothetical protein